MKALVTNKLSQYRLALGVGIGVGLYLRFLLLPTAVLFYELHHATGLDFIYWGYSGFKIAAYYFGVWEYQTLACIAAGLVFFFIALWRAARKQVEVTP